MNFKPLGERVLVKIINETSSGIIIPDCVKTQNYAKRKGLVMAVPDSLRKDIAVGNMLLLENWGLDVTLEGEDYKLIDIEYVICVLEE